MTRKDVTRSIDLLRIALGLETRAERNANADRIIKNAGMTMVPGKHGVLVQFRNGRAAFLESKAFS